MKKSELLKEELTEALLSERKNNPNLQCNICKSIIPIGDYAHEINRIGFSTKYYACSNKCKQILIAKIENGEVI